MEFEWDEQKNAMNRKKHGITFEDAVRIFENQHLVFRSMKNDEIRYLAIGTVNEVILTVVFTHRDVRTRIISARKASKNERTTYYSIFNS